MGENLEHIAKTYKVDYGTISRIKLGKTYRNIPWPDGSSGALGKRKVKKQKLNVYEAFRPDATVVQVDPAAIARAAEQVEHDDDARLMNVLKQGANAKPSTAVKAEYQRMPIDLAIEAFPDMSLLRAVQAHPNPVLTYVTEVVIFYAREKGVIAGLAEFKAFSAAVSEAARLMKLDDKMPDLAELING